VWRSLLDTTSALSRALTAELALESGLSSGDYQVLLALVEAEDNRIRSSVLADRIDWERSRLSHHLRRMETRVTSARPVALSRTYGRYWSCSAAAR